MVTRPMNRRADRMLPQAVDNQGPVGIARAQTAQLEAGGGGKVMWSFD